MRSKDPRSIVIGNTHPATIQGVEHRVGETATECGLDMALSEHVDRASDPEAREAFGADRNGLVLIDERDRALLEGARDGSCFAVIESFCRRTADEAREVAHAGGAKLGVLDQLLLDQHGKSVGVSAARPSTDLKLQRDLLDDDTPVG